MGMPRLRALRIASPDEAGKGRRLPKAGLWSARRSEELAAPIGCDGKAKGVGWR